MSSVVAFPIKDVASTEFISMEDLCDGDRNLYVEVRIKIRELEDLYSSFPEGRYREMALRALDTSIFWIDRHLSR